MKMQNTEMEFVAFDAQDVIATSNTGGGLTGTYFSGLVEDAFETRDVVTFNSKLNMDEFYLDDGGDIVINPKNSTYTMAPAAYYIINSATGKIFGSTYIYTIDATGTDTKPTGEFLSGTDEILAWLKDNVKLEQH